MRNSHPACELSRLAPHQRVSSSPSRLPLLSFYISRLALFVSRWICLFESMRSMETIHFYHHASATRQMAPHDSHEPRAGSLLGQASSSPEDGSSARLYKPIHGRINVSFYISIFYRLQSLLKHFHSLDHSRWYRTVTPSLLA